MFGFPPTQRPEGGQFKKNLLKSVIFQLKFQSNSEVVECFKRKKERLKQKFPITNPITLNTATIKIEKTPIILEAASSPNHGYEFKTKNKKCCYGASNSR